MFPGGKPPLEDFISSWYPILIALSIGLIVGVRSYFKGCPNPSTEKLKDKVVIVTGASSGMGKEIARDMAERGAKVYMACRNMEVGLEVAKDIITTSGNNKVAVMHLDLASFASVHAFVKSFKEAEDELNILVNNAGLLGQPRTLTDDKNDVTLQVNYLGVFLLSHLLLDRLLAAKPSRIINTTCHAFRLGQLNIDDLNFEQVPEADYKPGDMYGQSKLAVVLFTQQMARYLEGTDVTINAANPGVVNSQLYRNMPLRQNAFLRYSFSPITWMFMKPAKDGAQTALYIAVAKEEEGVSGKVYNECKIQPFEGLAADDDAAQQLWNVSFKLCGIPNAPPLQ